MSRTIHAIPFETYSDILQSRKDGLSLKRTCEKFGVSETVVQAVCRCHRFATAGDLAMLETQKNKNPRIYRWARQFLPEIAADPQLSIPQWTADPRVFTSPAPGLTAAKITETAVALLAKSLDEDGENTDFLRGVLALYKALHAPGASM